MKKNVRKALWSLIAPVIVCLAACGPDKPEIDEFATYMYYAPPMQGKRSVNLLLQKGEKISIFRSDTLFANLNETERDTLAVLLHQVQRWDTSYRGAKPGRYQEITRIRPDGLMKIRLYEDAEAPEHVDGVFRVFSAIANRVIAKEQRPDNPA